MPKVEELKHNLSDIQGNVIRGYKPSHTAYLFYEITNAKDGRRWLSTLLDEKQGFGVTTSARWTLVNGNKQKPRITLNVALSHRGLSALGLAPEILDSFPDDFKQGMERRAVEILGDEADNQHDAIPTNWEAGYRSQQICVLLFLSTSEDHDEAIKTMVKKLESLEKNHPYVQEIIAIRQYGDMLPTGTEHFGYADGISQPFLEGSESLYEDRSPRPPFKGQGTPNTKGNWYNVKPGEFLLGYEDEFGEVAQSPLHYDLRKNGTYLVFRKLEQDVQAFQEFLSEGAKHIWKDQCSQDQNYYEELLAGKLMGRWRSGCPMALSPEQDDLALARNPEENNNFLYQDDPDGLKCPLGSHLRRTNPRDEMLPAPRDIFDITKKEEYHLNRHRIIRRGMTYGSPYHVTSHHTKERGVIFMAINASISRQFEFLQQQWVNKGGFLGLDKNDRDPIIGQNADGNGKFTLAGTDAPFAFNLQRFVTERGGEYFFYPGISALRGIAEDSFSIRSTFLSDYRALQSMSHSFRTPAFMHQLVSHWLIWRAKEMFDELLKQPQIFTVPPITPPIHLQDLKKPPIVLATKYDDVLEILKDKQKALSVIIYTKSMIPPRGPFILGMEHHDPQYKKELKILQKAVPHSDLEKKIRPLIESLSEEIMNPIRKTGQIDVIRDLAWTVPLRLNRDYFGVSGPDEETFRGWCRDIYTDLFLNLRQDADWTRRANTAVDAMNSYLNLLIEFRHREIKQTKKVPDTVLTRLIKMQTKSSTRFHDGLDGVRRNIFGMVIGVVETTLKAVSRTVDQFLLRPDIMEEARKVALNKKDRKLHEFSKYVLEAMRFNPQNHVLFRVATKKIVLAKNTDRETVVHPGSLVFAGTLGAMFDKDKIEQPEEFRINRPADNYLFFGYDHHSCLGEYISYVQIPILVKQVLTLKGLKRRPKSKGGDQFDPLNLLPEHFYLEFEAQGQKRKKTTQTKKK